MPKVKTNTPFDTKKSSPYAGVNTTGNDRLVNPSGDLIQSRVKRNFCDVGRYFPDVPAVRSDNNNVSSDFRKVGKRPPPEHYDPSYPSALYHIDQDTVWQNGILYKRKGS